MTELRLSFRNLSIRATRQQILGENCERRYSVFYQKNRASELAALCDKYGSDKGEIATSGHPYPWPSHTYTDFYESLFGHCRAQIRQVFECGLGTNNPALPSTMGPAGRPGASLRVWREYFPNADIYGGDIDPDILFQEDRIATFHLDQTSPASIRRLWQQLGETTFDLIIDDGLHTFEAGRCFFEHSFARLRQSGVYVIEDVDITTMVEFRSYFAAKPHQVHYVTLERTGVESNDNALIVIRN